VSILDRILRRTSDFTNREQLFRAVDDLIAHLRAEGKVEIAEELASACGSLNGLTDGWSLFLDAIDNVDALGPKALNPDERFVLQRIRAAVRRLVFR
jgi:hypothetical protein